MQGLPHSDQIEFLRLIDFHNSLYKQFDGLAWIFLCKALSLFSSSLDHSLTNIDSFAVLEMGGKGKEKLTCACRNIEIAVVVFDGL